MGPITLTVKHLSGTYIIRNILIPLPLGVWERLRFVIVALPGLFSYLFFIVMKKKANGQIDLKPEHNKTRNCVYKTLCPQHCACL